MSAIDKSEKNFVKSNEINQNYRMFIGCLSLEFENCELKEYMCHKLREHNAHKFADVHMIIGLWWKETLLCKEVRTSYKRFENNICWDEWIEFQISYKDIPLDSIITFDLYNPCSVESSIGADNDHSKDCCKHVAGCSVPLWDKYSCIRQGECCLKLWLDKHSDTQLKSSSPGLPFEYSSQSQPFAKTDNVQENQHIRLITKHSSIVNDHHKLAELELIQRNDISAVHTSNTLKWLNSLSLVKLSMKVTEQRKQMNSLFLNIKFPNVRVINSDNDKEVNSIQMHFFELGSEAKPLNPPKEEFYPCPDGELGKDNIFEQMHLRLARSNRSGNKDTRPNLSDREKLFEIIKYPPLSSLHSDELDLVWNYRYFISAYPRALPKFLLSVHWSNPEEVSQATELLNAWTKIDIDEVILLLGSEYSHDSVRSFAINCLRQSNLDDICFFLPQLIQVLRYENKVKLKRETNDNRSLSNTKSPANRKTSKKVVLSELAKFLIEKSCSDLKIATGFYWYCKVEFEWMCRIDRNSPFILSYQCIFSELFSQLRNHSEKSRKIYRQLSQQRKLIEKLIELSLILKKHHGSNANRQEKLFSILSQEENILNYNFVKFPEPFPSLIDPNVIITGIYADKCKVYQSAQLPCKIVFRSIFDDKRKDFHTVIFKNGDDLRQDQLVMQLINLMDKIMKQDQLDLQLTPYEVLATGYNVGLVEYVESMTLRTIKQTHQTIRNYFLSISSKHNVDKHLQIKIDADLLDSYVRSCAGYCVITYLLGVGDRHLDNLMLRPTGQIFHIDFSFIFGRDPKPLPPAVKVNKDMIIAMEEKVTDFRKHCFTAFLHLRRHANVIFDLLSVMLDASIADISSEPHRVVTKVYEKFHFHLDDESAVSYLQRTIDQSISALVPQLMDILHGFATSVR
ncbi:hypothetical protein GJ496_000311 [Pomphorhynchus laevis]|nr:hypothetical protein GJ496_000311 [Pomphorhynchus laevis]